jgi:hypothetical protein
MYFVINLNMAIQVVSKCIEPAIRFGVQIFHDLAEDARQQVFAPKGESRRDRADVIVSMKLNVCVTNRVITSPTLAVVRANTTGSPCRMALKKASTVMVLALQCCMAR